MIPCLSAIRKMSNSITYMNLQKTLSWSRRNWQLTLLATIITAFLLILYAFSLGTTIASATIAVTPPAIYYFYTEFLDQPSLVITQFQQPWEISPMELPPQTLENLEGSPFMYGNVALELDMDDVDPDEFNPRFDGVEVAAPPGLTLAELTYEGQMVVRPVAFLNLSVENLGKATAERTHIQLRLQSEDHTYEYYARWSNLESTESYNLLPGQEHSTHALRVFLLTAFIPESDLVEIEEPMTEDDLKTHAFPRVSLSGQAPGEVWPTTDIFTSMVSPYVDFPREKRPESSGASIARNWEGNQINTEDSDQIFTLSARAIADNYQSLWFDLGELIVPLDAIQAALSGECWNKNWESSRQQLMRKRFERLIAEFVDNGD